MSLVDDMPVDDGSVEIILVLDEIVEFHFCHIVPLTDVVKDIFQVNGLYLLGAIIIGDMKFHGLCGGMDDVDAAAFLFRCKVHRKGRAAV